MRGGGGAKKFMQGKMPREKNRVRRKVKKKILAEGRSNGDFYFIII